MYSTVSLHNYNSKSMGNFADPKHHDADPDPSFHVDADPDSTFHLGTDPDLDLEPRQSDAKLLPLVLRPFTFNLHPSLSASTTLQSSILGLYSS
jgi:hypothetical protein